MEIISQEELFIEEVLTLLFPISDHAVPVNVLQEQKHTGFDSLLETAVW